MVITRRVTRADIRYSDGHNRRSSDIWNRQCKIRGHKHCAEQLSECESALRIGNTAVLNDCDYTLLEEMKQHCAQNSNYDICNNMRIADYYMARADGRGGGTTGETPAAETTTPSSPSPTAPNVRFIEVGGSTRVVFSVQNLESRSIIDTRVVDIEIEPSSYHSRICRWTGPPPLSCLTSTTAWTSAHQLA